MVKECLDKPSSAHFAEHRSSRSTMEELLQMCEGDGAALTIKLSRDWEELEAARKLLITEYGYVEDEHEQEEGILTLKKLGRKEDLPPATVEIASPGYGDKAAAASRSDDEGWEQYVPWQLDTLAAATLQAQVLKLKLSKQQRVGVTLQVQPSVKVHTGGAAVRLRIECLSVGVSKAEALRSEEHRALGFYPSRVTICFKPKTQDQQQQQHWQGIARYIGADDLDFEDRDVTKLTSASKAQLNMSLNPSLVLEQSMSKERQVSSKRATKVSVVRVIGAAHVACLEWMIQRWKSGGGSYDHELPHEGLKLLGTPKLPFVGTTVRLDGQFPDVEWKLPAAAVVDDLSIQIEVELQMDLVWFLGTKVSRPFAGYSSKTASVNFSCEWTLRKAL